MNNEEKILSLLEEINSRMDKLETFAQSTHEVVHSMKLTQAAHSKKLDLILQLLNNHDDRLEKLYAETFNLAL